MCSSDLYLFFSTTPISILPKLKLIYSLTIPLTRPSECLYSHSLANIHYFQLGFLVLNIATLSPSDQFIFTYLIVNPVKNSLLCWEIDCYRFRHAHCSAYYYPDLEMEG